MNLPLARLNVLDPTMQLFHAVPGSPSTQKGHNPFHFS